MPIAVACPHCGATGSAPDNFANRQVKCSKCKKPFTVKPPEQAPPPTPPLEEVKEVEEVIEDVSALQEEDDDEDTGKRKGDKKMARRRDDDDDDFDDEDDEPRGKRKRRDDDEDDFDDEDAPKKKRSSRDDDDDDDDDEDEKPSIKKKKPAKKKGGPSPVVDLLLYRAYIWPYVLAAGFWIVVGRLWYQSCRRLYYLFKSPVAFGDKWDEIGYETAAIFLAPLVIRVMFELIAAVFRLSQAVEDLRDK